MWKTINKYIYIYIHIYIYIYAQIWVCSVYAYLIMCMHVRKLMHAYLSMRLPPQNKNCKNHILLNHMHI